MSRYKLIFHPAIEKNLPPFEAEYESLELAQAAQDAVANYTLYLHEQGLMTDHSNIAEIAEFVDGHWQEIDEDALPEGLLPYDQPLNSGELTLKLTPVANIDFGARSVIDNSQVQVFRMRHETPLQVLREGQRYHYAAKDVDRDNHRVILGGVPHYVLSRLSVG